MRKAALIGALFVLGIGCGSSPAPTPASPSQPQATATSTKPDAAKATDHLKNHVKYPTTRAQVLAACADTPEFTAQEKKWFADNIPEGTFKSADEVMKALKL
jgi:hypothetical protein